MSDWTRSLTLRLSPSLTEKEDWSIVAVASVVEVGVRLPVAMVAVDSPEVRLKQNVKLQGKKFVPVNVTVVLPVSSGSEKAILVSVGTKKYDAIVVLFGLFVTVIVQFSR